MKRLLMTWAGVMMAVMAFAVPAKRGLWQTITLADGSQVKVQKCGDEHLHFFMSEQGQRYMTNPQTGMWEEVTAQDVENRYVKILAKRRSAPKRFGKPDKSTFLGEKKGLIILVEFTDKQFKPGHTLALYDRVVNETGYNVGNFDGSVRDYFHDQSNGMFDLTFDVVGPVELTKSYAYYGENDSRGNDLHPGEMVADACLAVDEEVDFSKYDWDGDGNMEHFYVIYAGQGEADSSDSDTVWPHMWDLAESDYGETLQLDGVTISTYACGNEVQPGGEIEGIGTLCHEFSHCMGFPDMYDIKYEGNYGMGKWDLMCSGSYNGDSYKPAGYTSWERWQCGWIEPIELTENTEVEDMKPINEQGDAYVIYNKAYPDEYYMLENRKQSGWDVYLPASGMLILHVDYDADLFAMNIVNATGSFEELGYYGVTNDHQRLTIFHADNDDDSNYWNSWWGGYYYTTEETDTYPYRTNNSLTNDTKPAAMLYHANSDGRKYMNVEVNNITKKSDGSIAFNFVNGNEEDDPDDPVIPDGNIFYESFNKCNGKGGNDSQWSGYVGNSLFSPDMDGWDNADNCMYGADRCARFGSGKHVGEVVSPKFKVEGTVTLTFIAAPWGGDGTQLNVAVENDDEATIEPSTFQLQGEQWTECTATIKANGLVSIKFSPERRFFLDEVSVVVGGEEVDGITEIKLMPHTSHRIFTIDGRYVGTDITALPHGLYIVDGKKVVK